MATSRTADPVTLAPFVGDDAVGLGLIGPVFINVWRGVPRVSSLQLLREAQAQVQAPHVVVTVVQEIPRGRLSEEARDLAEVIQAETRDRVRRHANVVEVTGFFAAAVRAIMASGNLMKGIDYPVKVFADVDEALGWLAATIESLDAACSVAAVRAAVDALREAPAS